MGPKAAGGKAAKAKAELEKKQEDQRLSDLSEFERLEAERVVVEKNERKLLAAEKKARDEENTRLDGEYAAHEGIKTGRAERLRLAELSAFEQTEWCKYIECSELPNPLDQADIDTFLMLIQQNDDFKRGYTHTLADCQKLEEIRKKVEALIHRYSQVGNATTAKYYADYITRLREIAASRLDQCTAHILQHVDEYEEEKSLQNAVATKDYKFGLWVNLAKNLRHKTLEFPELGMSMDLPKALALANIGIRMVHCHSDPTVAAEPRRLLTLGGVCYVEVLSLPPAAKEVKGWMLRPVTSLAFAVNRLPYGGGAAEAAGAGSLQNPPLKITFTLPHDVWVRANSTTLRVGWFNDDTQLWDETDITDVRVDSASRSISFYTLHLGALACIQDSYIDYPYAWWQITPTAENSVSVQICVPSLVVEILVRGDGLCQLAQPAEITEFAHLRAEWVSCLTLLHGLRGAGINLIPGADFQGIDGVTLKDKELEAMVAYNIGLVVSALRIVPSRWSQAGGAGEVVLRFAPAVHVAEPPDPLSDDGWATVIFTKDTPVRCHVAACTEGGEAYSAKPLEGFMTKALVSDALRGCVSEDVLSVAESAPPLLAHSVAMIIKTCQLLSLTDSTAEPTQNWFLPPDAAA